MISLTDALAEADKWFERGIALMVDEQHPFLAAARRVAEAPEVWWCQVHHSMEATTEQAGVCWLYDGDQDCRMVRKLLVDPAEENP